jgi:hypothetical protein
MKLRERESNNCIDLFGRQASRSPRLSVFKAEPLKLRPVSPHSLRIKAENRSDLAGGRRRVETTRLEKKLAAPGYGIPGLCTSVHDPLSFKDGTQLADAGGHCPEMGRETVAFNFLSALRILLPIAKRSVDTFFFEHYFDDLFDLQ